MSEVAYGSKVMGLSSRNVQQSEMVKPGAVYEATYAISGFRTIVPGWENDAISEVKHTIESKGGQVVYIGVSNNSVVVQWKHPVYAASAHARAAIAPIVVYGVVVAVTIILGIWLITTLTGSVKEISGIITESPQAAIAIYGCLALGVLFAIGFIMKQLRDD